MHVELPFNIHSLIVQQAGIPSHPHAYAIDSVTLHTLCFISRSFNRIATPLLYSSISFAMQQKFKSLAKTAGENPQLLKTCSFIGVLFLANVAGYHICHAEFMLFSLSWT
jgi:hypothetical protein